MKLSTLREKTQPVPARRAGIPLGKRLCSLLLALLLLLGLSGTAPGDLLSPMIQRAKAEDDPGGFVYRPNTIGLALLPRDDVLSLAKVQELETKNPGTVLNINSYFALGSFGNVMSPVAPKITDDLFGMKNWTASFSVNVQNDSRLAKVRDHLTNQAMDLEAFWSGSYQRSDLGDPAAVVWYYGNTDYAAGKGGKYSNYMKPFTERADASLSSGVPGAIKSGRTGGVPLAYEAYFEYYTYEVEFDQKGRILRDRDGYAMTFTRYHKDIHRIVVGSNVLIRPTPLGGSSQIVPVDYGYTPLNVTLSGAGGTHISDTKMRMRDNAAPFLNSITMKRNGVNVSRDAYIKRGDTLDIVLEFNEDVRFADNAANDHGLKLRLSFVDASNGTSDRESWVDADLISLEGRTMTFRFDPDSSQSGKTLPAELYVDAISANDQNGWFSGTDGFPLSLIDASGRTVSTGSTCFGIVTDLAGNPFEKINLTRFEGSARAHYDTEAPRVLKTSIWTTNLSEEEASSGNNPNETDPDKLFLKAGDRVSLKVVFSEELSTSNTIYDSYRQLYDENGTIFTPTAVLNVLKNGSAVTLAPSSIGTIDSKSIDVNAAARKLTVIEYEPLTVTADMTLDGDFIRIVSIDNLGKANDRSRNLIQDTTVPPPPYQQKIDVTPPTVTLGTTVDDTLDLDVFTVPLSFADAESGYAGKDFRFRLVSGVSGERGYLWKVDDTANLRREDDNKTVDTAGWAAASAVRSNSQDGWISVTPPVGAAQLYLHVKLLNTKSWPYALSNVAGAAEGTFKTATEGTVQVKLTDIKGNEGSGERAFTHAIGHDSETVIRFGGVSYSDISADSVTATIPVTVTNPMGVQKLVWGTSEDAMTNVEFSGELRKSSSFTAELTSSGLIGTVTLYVGAYGPDGTPAVDSVSYSYSYESGVLSYGKTLGEEKAPLFGLPVINNMSVTNGDRFMVLIDKGDGTFFATDSMADGEKNLFDHQSGTFWYELEGSAASDYSSLTVTERERASDQWAAEQWLSGHYGRVPIVLLNQNSIITNHAENGWDVMPGAYDSADGVVVSVEYAYLANGASFSVSPGVVYADSGDEVPAEVLSGSPAEPHDNLADYTFTVSLSNETDADANQTYGLRIVQSAQAELLYSADGTNYTTVRTVELPVGSSTKLSFLKADGEDTGWYKVVYRYTVNGSEYEETVASGVYLDNSSAIEADIESYSRSFDLYVREPMWKWGTYYTDFSRYSYASPASDSDVGEGEIVKIGLAPIQAPADQLPEGSERWIPSPDYPGCSVNDQSAYADRYYLTDNEVNALTFRFDQALPTAGSAAISRIGGENHFYAWSGNDPDGRESARAYWQTFTADGGTVTLTVTDGTAGFDYSDGRLPLTDGYNLVHYVVEYEGGETVEKSFMADVRTKAMDLGLDVYYHAADRYVSAEQMAAAFDGVKDLQGENGSPLYPTVEDYAASIGAVWQTVSMHINTDPDADPYDPEYEAPQIDESAVPTALGCYVLAGAKCTDEADLYHRNEAVVNPVLNDYDAFLAHAFTSYRHLDGELEERTDPAMGKLDPMGEERFRKSSDHELFFADDVYGNVSFASLVMSSIDGEAPEMSYSSNFAGNDFSDILRSTGTFQADPDDTWSHKPIYAGYDFLLNISDDHPLDLSSLSVSFDPAYSRVLDPALDGETETFSMTVPLNFEKDEMGYFKPWTISEDQAGKTGGITMTCLKMDTQKKTQYDLDNPNFHNIIGVEIQGAFKPCELAGDVVMTFCLTDKYGNTCTYPMTFYNDTANGRISSESYALCEGINDNSGWYEGFGERDADGELLSPQYYQYIDELPDWVPAPEYYEGDEGILLNPTYEWKEQVRSLLPEMDMYGTGTYFTNEGSVKLGVVPASQLTKEFRDTLPYALSVESYTTDYGVFTDGFVRTRIFEKLTGRFGSSASSYRTEQAIILPSVAENGSVTVNWTDVFGTKHEDVVNITAFGPNSGELGVHAAFSPAARTNEDVLVTLKGDRVKTENGTSTCEITGITVTLWGENGGTFDETDERVSIYASQPWNATVLMPANGTITVEYQYPQVIRDVVDDQWVIVGYHTDAEAEADPGYLSTGSKTIPVSTIDKTPPAPVVSCVFADTGEPVPADVTETTRPIRADVTADEPIEGLEGGLSCTFSYGAKTGDTKTFTVRDRAGNTASVTAVCPATISAPAAAENDPPTATVYLAANLGGVAKNLGTFTLSEDGETTVYSDGEGQTVNLNEEAAAAINAAIAASCANLFTLRFEIVDEAPAACTVVSSDPTVAVVGANNTVTVRENGTFSLTVSDNANNTSSLTGIVVGSLDKSAPEVTPVYGLYTAGDGTQRVRVAFKPEADEQIYPIITGEQNSRDILSTIYDVYAPDGTVTGQRTGFYTDFATNEDYTFYYKDAYGNESSVKVQVRGIDTEAPSVTSIRWSGTVNNMTPDTEGAGPTSRNVIAALNTDKGLSSAALYYYDKDAENHVGEALSAADAGKVRLSFSTSVVEITWTDNVASPLILAARSDTSGLTGYYELPAVTVIDKSGPTVVLAEEPKLAEEKTSKEFRFTVSGAEGELFTSNLAAAYTTETVGSEEVVTRYPIGVKGTSFIYTAKSGTPVTLRFTDDAGNTAEYALTAEDLADVDAATLSVSFNTAPSDEGALKNVSELKYTGTTIYVYPNKAATLTVTADGAEGAAVSLTAKTWNAVTVSDTADIQVLKFTDMNTGREVYAWIVTHLDRVAPAISYSGEGTVFADTGMAVSQIRTLLLADVSAYDKVDGSLTGSVDVAGASNSAGLHVVTYTVSDAAGNTAALERNLYVKGPNDPIIKVNGKDTVPMSTLVLDTKDFNITGECGLTGDNSVYLAIRPGIMTAARMKYASAVGTDSLLFTAPQDGFYTVLARNRDRTEVLTYIYVETAN